MKKHLFSLHFFLPLSFVSFHSMEALHLDESNSARRTPIVVAVEKAGPAVANISTERLISQRHVDPFLVQEASYLSNFSMNFLGKAQSKWLKGH